MQSNNQFNDKELVVLIRELRSVLERGVRGDVVEFGCYKGKTSMQIQRELHAHPTKKKLYVYDSFEGLPPKTMQDASPAGMQFTAGELPARKGDVVRLFKQSGVTMPIIKKAWFSDLKPQDVPEEIAFAFLDGDFYESIMDSLKHVWPKLTKGAVVIIDDYQNEALPGAQKAVKEWLRSHPARLKHESSLAIIYQDKK